MASCTWLTCRSRWSMTILMLSSSYVPTAQISQVRHKSVTQVDLKAYSADCTNQEFVIRFSWELLLLNVDEMASADSESQESSLLLFLPPLFSISLPVSFSFSLSLSLHFCITLFLSLSLSLSFLPDTEFHSWLFCCSVYVNYIRCRQISSAARGCAEWRWKSCLNYITVWRVRIRCRQISSAARGCAEWRWKSCLNYITVWRLRIRCRQISSAARGCVEWRWRSCLTL